MSNTLRLALVALISALALGCLIPVPVDGHRDRHRWHDRSWDDGHRHGDRGDWSRGDRDRGDR
jgi:hypothetical protein